MDALFFAGKIAQKYKFDPLAFPSILIMKISRLNDKLSSKVMNDNGIHVSLV